MPVSQSEIENAILRTLYEEWYQSKRTNNFHALREQSGLDENVFEKITARMEHNNLLHPRGIGYAITARGILHAEDREIISPELACRNRDARNLVLESLAKIYDHEGPISYTHYTELSSECGLDRELILNNLDLLQELHCVEHPAVGCYRISQYGLERIEDHEKRRGIAVGFEKLIEMSPQARGRAMQKLLAQMLEQHGWSQLEGARTSHEEMDVIVFREREYYLIECKWEKDPIEADVIRELLGKLTNRVDVRGIALSMSGFSRGTVTQVEKYASTRIILLFGPEDVRSMVHAQAKFDDLLNEKYKELVVHNKALFH
jgi:hypothetical protein